jgi:RNA polymerase sigma-70 factor, ECF subfamily
MEPAPTDVTELLSELEKGKKEAADQLFPLVYDQLRQIAGRYMHGERPDHTLQATALVHEAFLELTGEPPRHFPNRAHFLAFAAKVMRRFLVDYAKGRNAQKRAGTYVAIPLEEIFNLSSAVIPSRAPGADQFEELLGFDLALERLAKLDPRQAMIVELRVYGGLTEEEIADFIGVSSSTVKRDWASGRAWLIAELELSPHGDVTRKVGSR